MRLHFVRSCVVALLAGAPGSLAFAQYPQVPPEDAARANALMEASRQHADAQWEKARPIVEEWAQKGRPHFTRVDGPGDFVKAAIPAFPGAEGPAMWSVGGRGGRVIVVTSLEDSGPGTFREALEAGGPRIIVFNVAGIIRLKSPISIRAPYVTISGATAPGDGVCIAGETVWIDTHDVVIRHMRFRRGETWVGRRDDALGGNPVGNIMVDHVSASWGLDENMSFYRYNLPEGGRRATTNVTIQWSISSEALNIYNHSFGSTIGGTPNAFHHNLMANNAGRNPSMSMADPFNWINNVVFNWRHRTADGGVSGFNGINNYYKPGPVTDRNAAIGHRIVRIEGRGEGRGTFYVDGNVIEGNDAVTNDNWAGGVQRDDGEIAGFRAKEPAGLPEVITIHPAKEAYELVLAGAGATLPRRDAVDVRVIENVRTGIPTAKQSRADLREFLHTVRYRDDLIDRNIALIAGGIIVDPADVGGYPDYKGEPYTDTDGDGMADDWETRHGLNPNDASDAITSLRDGGYTNIECFIHGIDPRDQPDWTDLKNNIDRASVPEKRSDAGRENGAAGNDDAAAANPGPARAREVVAKLNLPDPAAADRTEKLLADYYTNLHDILAARQAKLDAIEATGEKNDAAVTEAYAVAKDQYVPRRLALIANLAVVVDQPTVEQIKDAMTGGVMLQTYRNYLDMAPALTDAEKAHIYAWMLEARENALDAFTAKQQHQWFAKYRGKINNYIVAQGYDFKTLSSEWAAKNNRTKGP